MKILPRAPFAGFLKPLPPPPPLSSLCATRLCLGAHPSLGTLDGPATHQSPLAPLAPSLYQQAEEGHCRCGLGRGGVHRALFPTLGRGRPPAQWRRWAQCCGENLRFMGMDFGCGLWTATSSLALLRATRWLQCADDGLCVDLPCHERDCVGYDGPFAASCEWSVVPPPPSSCQLCSGWSHALVLLVDGSMYAWGRGDMLQLGAWTGRAWCMNVVACARCPLIVLPLWFPERRW